MAHSIIVTWSHELFFSKFRFFRLYFHAAGDKCLHLVIADFFAKQEHGLESRTIQKYVTYITSNHIVGYLDSRSGRGKEVGVYEVRWELMGRRGGLVCVLTEMSFTSTTLLSEADVLHLKQSYYGHRKLKE